MIIKKSQQKTKFNTMNAMQLNMNSLTDAIDKHCLEVNQLTWTTSKHSIDNLRNDNPVSSHHGYACDDNGPINHQTGILTTPQFPRIVRDKDLPFLESRVQDNRKRLAHVANHPVQADLDDLEYTPIARNDRHHQVVSEVILVLFLLVNSFVRQIRTYSSLLFCHIKP